MLPCALLLVLPQLLPQHTDNCCCCVMQQLRALLLLVLLRSVLQVAQLVDAADSAGSSSPEVPAAKQSGAGPAVTIS